MMEGPHDRTIGEYLRRLPNTSAEMPEQDRLRRFQHLGLALSNEIRGLDGEPFIVEDEAGEVTGLAVAGPTQGLAIIALTPDQRTVEVRLFGRRIIAVLTKSTPVDDDFSLPYRLTIDHEALPNGSVIYQTSKRADFERTYSALTTAFGRGTGAVD
jgi:hypothetical protein